MNETPKSSPQRTQRQTPTTPRLSRGSHPPHTPKPGNTPTVEISSRIPSDRDIFVQKDLALSLAHIIAPVVLQHCQRVLQELITIEKTTTVIPKHILDEVLLLLDKLLELDLAEGVILQFPDDNKDKPSGIMKTHPKSHLIFLYPLLCELITSNQLKLREELKRILQEVYKHIKFN